MANIVPRRLWADAEGSAGKSDPRITFCCHDAELPIDLGITGRKMRRAHCHALAPFEGHGVLARVDFDLPHHSHQTSVVLARCLTLRMRGGIGKRPIGNPPIPHCTRPSLLREVAGGTLLASPRRSSNPPAARPDRSACRHVTWKSRRHEPASAVASIYTRSCRLGPHGARMDSRALGSRLCTRPRANL